VKRAGYCFHVETDNSATIALSEQQGLAALRVEFTVATLYQLKSA